MRGWKIGLLLLPLVLLLAGAVYAAVVGWQVSDGAEISVHAYLAMALGISGTLLLTGLLVGLLLYSNRTGVDERSQRLEAPGGVARFRRPPPP